MSSSLFSAPPDPNPSPLYYSSPPPPPAPGPVSPVAHFARATLLWGNFEPWMDEEYAKQVCALMRWDPISITIPQPTQDASTHNANNPGYCFLSFPNPARAASVLAQVYPNGKSSPALTMPNSTKSFVLSWAPATVPSLPPQQASQQYQKEYSIFVGDLAPETSNSDLVAVFRNPVLGLRNDREPKFIRPFLSCKSAKIMLDPITGISRGYGFVRFTDEADQQRALIEMHGLYCLSRPMRISPATAKFKPPPSELSQPILPDTTNVASKSVSAPIAATNSNSSLGSQPSSSNNSMGGSSSGGSLSSNSAVAFFNNDRASVPSVLSEAQLRQAYCQSDGYLINEESWKHHAQARAILGNLIGPNGEQLTSTDPYNTTVFVGGLSPLISEDTLRTFFAPFGDIHYVKVPVGKHCGFVQFVRKADAERAIEKMQGFPIGGSRIRLSWGRSQYKAAQAAAQAAQAAALQAHYTTAHTTPTGNAMTPDQALSLLYKLRQQGYISPANNEFTNINGDTFGLGPDSSKSRLEHEAPQNVDAYATTGFIHRPDIQRTLSNFSPFSPDPNTFVDEAKPRETSSLSRADALPHPSKAYAPGFYPHHQLQAMNLNQTNSGLSVPAGNFSPSARPFNASRYAPYLEISDRAISRPEPSPSSQSSSSGPVRQQPDRSSSSPTLHRREPIVDRDRDNEIEDVSLTLASLKFLDDDHRSYASPEISAVVGLYQQRSFLHGHERHALKLASPK